MAVQRPASGSVPTSPGSYQFKDEHGRVIYVGKAKSLRARVRSYFAEGAAEIMVDPQLNPWDSAAIVPIVATAFGLAAVIASAGVAYLLTIPAFYGVLKPARR